MQCHSVIRSQHRIRNQAVINPNFNVAQTLNVHQCESEVKSITRGPSQALNIYPPALTEQLMDQ